MFGLVDRFSHFMKPFTNCNSAFQLKSFLKKCKVPNYTKKMKHLLDKIKENQDFIESKRKDVTFAIGDPKAVKDWEVITVCIVVIGKVWLLMW